MTMPKHSFVTIVMPLYNKEAEVERAMRSVLVQSFRDYELIVVNDGSTDKGPDVVATIGDSRIRMVHQENAGVSAARNRGIEEARTDLIAFLDADDEWKPDFLETILRLRKKFAACKVFATQYLFRSPDGRQRPAIVRGLTDGFLDGVLVNYFDIAAKSDPPVFSSAVVVEKKAIIGIGGFPVGITSGEDLLTWARLATKFRIAYSIKPCAIHYNPQSVSDRPGRIPQEPDMVENALRELLSSADSATIPGLKAYIGLWHRMRAIIFIQLGKKRNALRELMEAMRTAPSVKLFLLFLIASLPGSFPVMVLMSIKKVRTDS
ncbi:MAG: glycosyltransferase [Pseudomonadota bacterium]